MTDSTRRCRRLLLRRSRPSSPVSACFDRQGQGGRRQRARSSTRCSEAGALIARGRLTHSYPHSWRSKEPVIFRNTPQWFVAMDKPHRRRHGRLDGSDTIRERALTPRSTEHVARVPAARAQQPHPRHGRGPARLGAVAPARLGRADHRVSSRGCRARDPAPRLQRVRRADRPHRAKPSQAEGADAWFEEGAKERFLARPRRRPCRLGEGQRHPRRLVRFRLHPRLRARDAPRSALAGRRSISKAPTSIAAGSNPRCSRPAARAAARPTRRCSPMASSSTRTGRKMSKSLGNVDGAAGRDHASPAPRSCGSGWP